VSQLLESGEKRGERKENIWITREAKNLPCQENHLGTVGDKNHHKMEGKNNCYFGQVEGAG